MKLKRIIQSKFGTFVLRHLPTFLMYPGKPKLINLELTNICNLSNCVLCPYKLIERKKEIMNVEKYKKLIDELETIKPILYLSAWGESIIHPNCNEMVKYASIKGFETRLSSNLNMNLTDKQIEEMVNSGLDILIVGLDGTTQKIYEKYRIEGDFDKVIRNINKIVAAKKKFNSDTPCIRAQFIVMKHNEHEIQDVEILCSKLGIDELCFTPVMLMLGSSSNGINLIEKQKMAKQFLPKNPNYSLFEFNENYDVKLPVDICPVIKQATILVNGDMTICCRDYNSSMIIGNAFKESFINIWKSKRYKKIRKMIIKKQFPICQNCQLSDFQINKMITFKK